MVSENRNFQHPANLTDDPRMLKPLNSRFGGQTTLNSKVLTLWRHPKSKLLASSQPDRSIQNLNWILVFKNLNSKVLTSYGHPKSKLLASSLPDRWSQHVKAFPFKFLRPQTFDFRRFQDVKPLNSMFLDPKTSNSKVLTSWGHLPGSLDAKLRFWMAPRC